MTAADDLFWLSGGILAVLMLLAFVFGKMVRPMWKRASAFLSEQDKVVEAAKRMSLYLDWQDKFRVDWDGTLGDAGHAEVPGVMERLNKIDGEFYNNGDGSMKSTLMKAVAATERTNKRIDGLDKAVKEVMHTVESLVSPTAGGPDNRVNTEPTEAAEDNTHSEKEGK